MAGQKSPQEGILDSSIETGASKLVRDLAEGYSIQSRITNRLWLSMLPLIFLILAPPALYDIAVRRDLPFGFGSVEESDFRLISFFLLCALNISFHAARAQALTAYSIAHRAIDQASNQNAPFPTQRQFFDMLHTPTLLRVGSLVVEFKSIRKFGLSRMAGPFYFLAKACSTMVFYGLPMYAQVFAFQLIYELPSISTTFVVVAVTVVSISMISFLQNVLVEARESLIVGKKLMTTNT